MARSIPTRSRRRRLPAVAALGCLAVLVAACGSSSSTAAPSVTTIKSGASGGSGLAEATAALTAAAALPKFIAPGPSIKAKSLVAGKTLLVVPSDSEIPYDGAFDDAVKAAASQVGMKTTVYNTTGEPTQWASAISLGISQHVAAIDLVAGLDVSQVIPQIQQATKAGIPVIGSTYNGTTQASPAYLSADVPLGYAAAGKLEADEAIASTKGKADVLVITSNEILPSQEMTKSVKATFAAECPACKVKVIDVPVTQWATEEQSQVEAAFAADPSINYVLPNYDSESEYVVPALTAKGDEGKVGVASFNGTPAPMALLQKGQISMDVGEDIAWAGDATVDASLRSIGKASGPVQTLDEHIPLRVFDKANAKEVGTPPNLTSGYGTAYEGYLKLWGLG